MLTCVSAICHSLLLLSAAPAPLPRVAENSRQFLEEVVKEVGLPPCRPFGAAVSPPKERPDFEPRLMATYARTNEPSRLLPSIRKARALLWALAPGSQLPADLRDVKGIPEDLKESLTILRDGCRVPANENRFKEMLLQDGRRLAVILFHLEEELEELQAAGQHRDKETQRWQAHYDLTLAYLHMQIAYLYEYQSLLGTMRKELPPRDPARHGGWKLVAQPRPHGDFTGKKMATEAHKLLDRLVKDHPGTPWEMLAQQARLVPLGLEWEPAP